MGFDYVYFQRREKYFKKVGKESKTLDQTQNDHNVLPRP